MNIRRLVLDVDKAISRPTLIEIAGAIAGVSGVQGCNITVTDIDVETVGMDTRLRTTGLSCAGKAISWHWCRGTASISLSAVAS